MKRIALIFLFCCMLYTSGYAQKGGLEKDSLPVFIIQDRELASIVDDFIAKAQKIDCHAPTAYHIYVNLYDINLTDEVHFLLDRRIQHESSDSLILYKNPYYHQAFIRHRDVLFRANIHSYADSFNYHLLTEMLKVLPEKQAIYFKTPPPDFYDLNQRGGHPMEDTILDSVHEYSRKKWFHGIRIYKDDDEFLEVK